MVKDVPAARDARRRAGVEADGAVGRRRRLEDGVDCAPVEDVRVVVSKGRVGRDSKCVVCCHEIRAARGVCGLGLLGVARGGGRGRRRPGSVRGVGEEFVRVYGDAATRHGWMREMGLSYGRLGGAKRAEDVWLARERLGKARTNHNVDAMVVRCLKKRDC